MAPWLDISLRSAALFLGIWFLLRLTGKKNITVMTPFQFVVFLVVGVVAALTSTGMIRNPVLGIAALLVWVVLSVFLDYGSMKSKWFHDLVYGRETVLISHGKVLEENLGKVRLTGEELLSSLRRKNVFNVSDAEFAMMENTGEINVLLKSEKRPLVPKDFGRKISPGSAPQLVILDGNILHESLTRIGLTREWLDTEIEKAGLSLDNIFIGQVDTFGELYLDLFDDSIQMPRPKVRDLLFANLEKCQADLASFALETENPGAREMYLKNSCRLKEVREKLEPYLIR